MYHMKKVGAGLLACFLAVGTEAEAAEYIGVTDDVMKMMREKLKSFEGAYVSYYYTDAEGIRGLAQRPGALLRDLVVDHLPVVKKVSKRIMNVGGK